MNAERKSHDGIDLNDRAEAQRIMDCISSQAHGQKKGWVHHARKPGGYLESSDGMLYRNRILCGSEHVSVQLVDLDFVDSAIGDTSRNEQNADVASEKMLVALSKVGARPFFDNGAICFTIEDAAALFAGGIELPPSLIDLAQKWARQQLARGEARQ